LEKAGSQRIVTEDSPRKRGERRRDHVSFPALFMQKGKARLRFLKTARNGERPAMSYALAKPTDHSTRGSRLNAAAPAPRETSLPTEAGNIAVRSAKGENGDEAVIIVSGDLDLANVLEFRDVAFSAIGQKPALLFLDLSSVTFVDTAGLSALLTVVRVARMIGARARLNPSPRVRRLLVLSGLADALEA